MKGAVSQNLGGNTPVGNLLTAQTIPEAIFVKSFCSDPEAWSCAFSGLPVEAAQS